MRDKTIPQWLVTVVRRLNLVLKLQLQIKCQFMKETMVATAG
jgi:hypothetical protein